MENNYSKGKNVEEPLERDRIPIPNLPADFLWMQVRGGKIRNLLNYAFEEFQKKNCIIWTGVGGPAVGKAVTCAEIMKREYGNLHQITKICYSPGKLPMIHILLSMSPLNAEELGYQGPG